MNNESTTKETGAAQTGRATRLWLGVVRGLRPAAGRWLAAGCAVLVASVAVGGVFYRDGATTLHFAFEGSPNGDRPVIRPPAFYQADDGFGFVDSPDVIGTARGVTAPKHFRFDANVPAGVYEVTVVLGGTPAESITRIKAGNHQPVTEDVRIAPGATATKTFTVTVPPGRNDGPSLDRAGRMSLEFVGTNPSLMKLDIKRAAGSSVDRSTR